MVTKHEQRVLYLIHKAGGSTATATISQGMSRAKASDRQRALANLENMELISSAAMPPKRGRGGMRYWLTKAGQAFVDDEIAAGRMNDPALEPRAGKGGRRASS